MAKNKNRKQDNSSPAERSAQEARTSSLETQAKEQTQAQGTPSDVARKHQRRFGHN